MLDDEHTMDVVLQKPLRQDGKRVIGRHRDQMAAIESLTANNDSVRDVAQQESGSFDQQPDKDLEGSDHDSADDPTARAASDDLSWLELTL